MVRVLGQAAWLAMSHRQVLPLARRVALLVTAGRDAKPPECPGLVSGRSHAIDGLAEHEQDVVGEVGADVVEEEADRAPDRGVQVGRG